MKLFNKGYFSLSILYLWCVPLSYAGKITFETIPGVANPSEGMEINTQYQQSDGVTFRLEDGRSPLLAEVGAPLTAFGGPPNHTAEDTPAPGQGIGRFFLTDDGTTSGGVTPILIIDYDPPTVRRQSIWHRLSLLLRGAFLPVLSPV